MVVERLIHFLKKIQNYLLEKLDFHQYLMKSRIRDLGTCIFAFKNRSVFSFSIMKSSVFYQGPSFKSKPFFAVVAFFCSYPSYAVYQFIGKKKSQTGSHLGLENSLVLTHVSIAVSNLVP